MLERILSVKYTEAGEYHRINGVECQDHVEVFEDEEMFIAVLSDGIGSLSNALLSAQCTCKSAITCLYNYNLGFSPETIAEGVVDYIQQQLLELAVQKEISPETMGCTLAFVALKKRTGEAVMGSLGDSAVCVLSNDGSHVYSNYYGGSATGSILDADAASTMLIDRINTGERDVLGFVLCSDGLENEIYIKGSTAPLKSAEFYINGFETEEKEMGLLETRIAHLKSQQPDQFDDDIGIIIVKLNEGKLSLPDEPTWLCTCGARNSIQQTYCERCQKDFSVIYRGIRFKSYDDKRAYFLNENQKENHPDSV